MKNHYIKSNEIVEGLSVYITELDSLRPPSRFGVSSLSFVGTMELLFKQRQKYYFFKNNRELKQKISTLMHDFRTDTNVDSKEMVLPIVFLFSDIFVIMAITIGITNFYSLNIIQGCLILVLVGLPLLFVFFSYVLRNRRKVLGERHDKELKKSVQLLIDFGVQFCTENNLNPEMFPIKIRHDDYNGLVYETKGHNNFVGFLKNETE